MYLVYKYLFTLRSERKRRGGLREFYRKDGGLDPGLVGENNVKSSFVTVRRDKVNELWTCDSIPRRGGDRAIMPIRPDSYDINPGNCN